MNKEHIHNQFDKILGLRNQGIFVALDFTIEPTMYGWIVAKPGKSLTGRTDSAAVMIDQVIVASQELGAKFE